MTADGDVRKLSQEEAACKPPNIWFLPLLAVQNPNKSHKVRLGLDAAAQSHVKSLNNFLLQGPDYLNSTPAILLRWRERKVALASDVIAMFSQVRVM